jgi:uncharacterized protein (TIGR02271 family)
MQSSTNTQNLVRLSDANDLRVAEGNEDIRGWEVRGSDGEKIGTVKDLLIDPTAMRARYLDVDLKGGLFGGGRRVLVPVGQARLDDDDDKVLLQTTADQLKDYPEYDGSTVSRDYETSLRSRLAGGAAGATAGAAAGSSNFYDNDHYDERGLFGSRRQSAEPDDRGEARMTVAREELKVGKRRVQAGEAYLRKTVETEHVRETVPLMHEEVTIERRPISSSDRVNATIGQDQEIRVPLMAEEAVAEKRVVGEEEVVLHKRAVEEQRTVEADLRRERVDVVDGVQTSGAAGTTGATGAAGRAGDKLADKLDDVKDRFDGNPASRPGRDATDRPTR